MKTNKSEKDVVYILERVVNKKIQSMSKSVKVKVVNTSRNELPKYSHAGDAGCDVRANLSACKEKFMYGGAYVKFEGDKTILHLPSGSRALIPSGIKMQVPEGYEVQVRPRSGLALKHGITLTNCIGTIDAPYTGDVGLIVQNTGKEPFEIMDGDRIGQFVLNKVETIEWVEVDSLDGYIS